MTSHPSREELIALCERAVVPMRHWHDRDSASAHLNIGEAWVLLSAGCPFTFDDDESHDSWWVTITYRGFSEFESGEEASTEIGVYIPKAERLDVAQEVVRKDWY